MPRRETARPKNWRQISDDIRFHRALEQCECNYHCHTANHHGRCPNMHGITPTNSKHPVVLQVTTLNDPYDFRPENLIALCPQCYVDHASWKKKRDAEQARIHELSQQMDTLFDVEPSALKQSRED